MAHMSSLLLIVPALLRELFVLGEGSKVKLNGDSSHALGGLREVELPTPCVSAAGAALLRVPISGGRRADAIGGNG